ncbi:MAG: anhydro-N-acetylmuramic acid kinase [Nonlabens sp.]|uniref:anhydro-N-acetylmuramic acid kinase n=1 Tax=Nonlabens sp. TaxID=1888209 RepID=UPI003EF63B7C
MKHQCYNVIGVMSGTSLDAIDIVNVELVRDVSWSFHVKAAKSIDYTNLWRERLSNAVRLDENNLKVLNKDYTHFLAQSINAFVNECNVNKLLAICSHGHTVHHQPQNGFTFQIGNLPDLARLLNTRVVCDFRVQDVKYGGQGAPLVPIGDKLLFSQYDFCLNLGGFANVSYDNNEIRIAYDIAPVNVVLNNLANKLGAEYDDKGAFAKAGSINTQILNQLNILEYYNLQAPKSLGIEWVNSEIWQILSHINDVNDALATFTEHAAIQIAKVFNPNSTVLVTGGGAYNIFLLERIRYHCNASLIVPDKQLVEYKEALIFALLGVLRLRNENNCLASVTGASRDHSSGEIYLP